MVTAEELIKFHEATCQTARALVKPKGQDYSPNAETDTLESLRKQHEFGITKSHAHTALGYVIAKASRIKSLLEGKTPNFETIDESINDLINYSVYCLWFVYEENAKKNLFQLEDLKDIWKAGRINMNDKSEGEKEVDIDVEKKFDITRKDFNEIRKNQEENVGK